MRLLMRQPGGEPSAVAALAGQAAHGDLEVPVHERAGVDKTGFAGF